MRHLYLFVTAFLLTISTIAQTPDSFQYQALVRDAEGNLRMDENVNITLRIIRKAPGGDVVYYTENHSVTTTPNGVVSLMVGEGDSNDDMTSIDWSKGLYAIEVKVDGRVMGETRLLSVPYARYADESGDSFSGAYSDLSDTPDLSDTTEWKEAYAWGDHKEETDHLREKIRALEAMLGIGSVEDSEGNNYKTVKIGDQVWMAENLKVTQYADGSGISGLYWYRHDFTNDGQIDAADSTFYVDTYGFLYSWPAVMNGAASSNANPSGVQGVCPDGWHVPSSDEWEQLRDTLGGYDLAGGKLKERGTDHWNSPNDGATNESGFTALPGGNRLETGYNYQIGGNAYYQTSTEYSSTQSNVFRVFKENDNLSGHYWEKGDAGSVRCVKNQ